MNQWLVAFGVLGSLASIFSVGWAFYSTAILKKAVRVTSLREIRTLINRLNEDKKKLEENSPAWMTMHHTQQNLDALFKSLQNDFNIADRDAPLS